MKRSMVISFLLLTTAIAASAQSTRLRPAPHPVQLPADWKIEITTSGGFTGSGNGGLIVSSDGSLTITFGNAPSAFRCNFQLTAEQLQTLDAAVRNSQPQSWMGCYSLASVSTHCCDLIRTTFSLSARDGSNQYVTSWLTGSQGLPQDLSNLMELLRGAEGIDNRYRRLCVAP
jgi:hypothetical protein